MRACEARQRVLRADVAGMLLVVMALAGCASAPPIATPAPAPVPLPSHAAHGAEATPPATIGCDPAPAQALVGQLTDSALEARARRDAGASSVRTLLPRQATTREYMEGRLNLQVDGSGRLTGAYCG